MLYARVPCLLNLVCCNLCVCTAKKRSSTLYGSLNPIPLDGSGGGGVFIPKFINCVMCARISFNATTSCWSWSRTARAHVRAVEACSQCLILPVVNFFSSKKKKKYIIFNWRAYLPVSLLHDLSRSFIRVFVYIRRLLFFFKKCLQTLSFVNNNFSVLYVCVLIWFGDNAVNIVVLLHCVGRNDSFPSEFMVFYKLKNDDLCRSFVFNNAILTAKRKTPWALNENYNVTMDFFFLIIGGFIYSFFFSFLF